MCNEPNQEMMQSCCAGKDCDLPMPNVTKDSAKPGAKPFAQQPVGHALLQVVRAVVTLVFLWCNRACEAHRMQKVLKQV